MRKFLAIILLMVSMAASAQNPIIRDQYAAELNLVWKNILPIL